MSQTARPVAALFDMDGLLLDTERLGLAVNRDLMVRHGVDEDLAGRIAMEAIGTASARTYARIAEVVPGLDVAAFDAEWRARVDAAMAENVPLRPTVGEVLQALADRDVPMAVVTTTRTERARHHLEVAGLAPFFRDVIGFGRYAAAKPDPAPYLTGAEVLGLDPARCAAFEDSDTGVTAARAAGCPTWQVPDLRPAGKPFPDLGQGQAATLLDAVRAAGLLS